jgi:hypothetical protein
MIGDTAYVLSPVMLDSGGFNLSFNTKDGQCTTSWHHASPSPQQVSGRFIPTGPQCLASYQVPRDALAGGAKQCNSAQHGISESIAGRTTPLKTTAPCNYGVVDINAVFRIYNFELWLLLFVTKYLHNTIKPYIYYKTTTFWNKSSRIVFKCPKLNT